MRHPGLFAAVALGVLAAAGPRADAGGTLPKGPPWHRNFIEAHAEAARTGKPLFVYFTKTY